MTETVVPCPGRGRAARAGHILRPLLHVYDSYLMFEVQASLPPRYPFRCTFCPHVEWHTAERAVELGLVLTVEMIS